MKKYIYSLFMVFLAVATMTSCTEDEGTEPGNDSNPAITLYQYSVSKPNNPDNDVALRFATNNRVSEVYYLAEKTEEREAYIKANGEDAYLDYVVEKGTKLTEVSGASNIDVMITDLYGEYTITAVATSGSVKTSAKTVFTGLEWEDVVMGTYIFATKSIAGASSSALTGMTSAATTLQVCTTDDMLYRFKDVFGDGYHMKIKLINYKGTDDAGEYQFFRIPAAETPFIVKNEALSIRDFGYWQGSDAFVTDQGYESGMYADYTCFLLVTHFNSGGTYGYSYDNFIPN